MREAGNDLPTKSNGKRNNRDLVPRTIPPTETFRLRSPSSSILQFENHNSQQLIHSSTTLLERPMGTLDILRVLHTNCSQYKIVRIQPVSCLTIIAFTATTGTQVAIRGKASIAPSSTVGSFT